MLVGATGLSEGMINPRKRQCLVWHCAGHAASGARSSRAGCWHIPGSGHRWVGAKSRRGRGFVAEPQRGGQGSDKRGWQLDFSPVEK